MNPVRILAIGGSLRAASHTKALLVAAAKMAPAELTVVCFEEIGLISAFDPGEPPNEACLRLKEAVAASDGVLIATPEYAHGVPGALKNALDWLVGSGELSERPVAVISASPTDGGGERARVQLVQTLGAMNATLVATISVPFVGLKYGPEGGITDTETLKRLSELMTRLAGAVRAT